MRTINLRIFFLVALIFSILFAKAQVRNLARLTVGEMVPNVVIGELINFSTKKINLHDFKGKLLILDFWDRACGPCITSFPRLEKIQEQYQGKIQVLLVTKNSFLQVKHLFENSEIVKKTRLPFVIGDTVLSKLFPYRTVPYHVWIDSGGIVRATAEAYNLTKDNINDYLSGREVKFAMRNDSLNIPSKVMLADQMYNQIKEERLQYYSSVTGRLNGYSGSYIEVIRESRKNVGLRMVNVNALVLYSSAYSIPKDRIVLEMNDKRRFLKNTNDDQSNGWPEWSTRGVFCYVLRTPVDNGELKPERRKIIMQQDLERYFGYRATLEKRMLSCLVLKRLTENDLIKTKYSKMPANMWRDKSGDLILTNFEFKNFVAKLRIDMQNLMIPLLDETHYVGRVDMTLRAELSNRYDLGKELQRYGLTLEEEMRELEVLVLREP